MTYSEIEPLVWVGPQPSIQDLRSRGIRSVVSLRRSTPIDLGIDQYHRPLTYWDPDFEFGQLIELIELVETLRNSGPTLVHCMEGVDRSGFFAISLLRQSSKSIPEAYARYTALRPTIMPRYNAEVILANIFKL